MTRALPHLEAFLHGYLHQDFLRDHEGPAAVLAAFLSECGPEERKGLRDDWMEFQQATAGCPWRTTRKAFARLGGTWLPPSRLALDRLFTALE